MESRRFSSFDVAPSLFLAVTLAAACGASSPGVLSTEAEPANAHGNGEPASEVARNTALAEVQRLDSLDDAGSDGPATLVGIGDDGLSAEAVGALTGADIGAAQGPGGLGPAGTGRDDDAGHGALGTLGHWSGQDYGSDGGGLWSSRPRRTDVRVAAASVQGGLDRDLVQRIVARAIPQLYACYWQGLTRDERLQGRLSVRVTVAADGSVTSVETGGDLPGDAVRACVRQVFTRMSFPKPDPPGVVSVSYPLVFTSGKNDALKPVGDAGSTP